MDVLRCYVELGTQLLKTRKKAKPIIYGKLCLHGSQMLTIVTYCCYRKKKKKKMNRFGESYNIICNFSNYPNPYKLLDFAMNIKISVL